MSDIGNRLRALEEEVRGLGKPDWRAIARVLADAENPRGTFHLPAGTPAEVVSMARLICGMERAMPRDPREAGPAVFLADRQLWPAVEASPA